LAYPHPANFRAANRLFHLLEITDLVPVILQAGVGTGLRTDLV